MSLTAEHITFSYKKNNHPVMEDFSAVFEEGRITALCGPNGCGKTTLSKIIVGILKPSQGRILVDGEDTSAWSLAQMGKKVGYVMQNPMRQIFSPTVMEEIEYGLRARKLPEEEIKQRANHYLAYFDLEKHRDSFPFALSHGEKQRLVLAAVLAMKPEYLILDEPTASLDMKRRAALGDYLLQVREDLGCGILIISHDKSFVQQYADETLTMGGKNV